MNRPSGPSQALAPSLAVLPPPVRAYLEDRQMLESGVQALAGDASTRRYFRLSSPGGTQVLALYPEPFRAEDSSFLSVRALLAECGLPVPAVLDVDGPRGVLLLEDLGDVSLQQAMWGALPAEGEAHYREALEQLARLQERAASTKGDAPCFRLAFDSPKLCWELQHFQQHFLEGHRGCRLDDEDRSALARGFAWLADEIASWPRVLCHRDFHSRNLMLKAGTLHWIDFQDARLGPASYDLASLLRDSYLDLDERFVAQCCAEFRARACPGEDPAVFERRFELMSVQRNLKALGTFGFMHTVRGSDTYLPYVPRTLSHARRNLARHPELQALWRVLARHVEELQ